MLLIDQRSLAIFVAYLNEIAVQFSCDIHVIKQYSVLILVWNMEWNVAFFVRHRRRGTATELSLLVHCRRATGRLVEVSVVPATSTTCSTCEEVDMTMMSGRITAPLAGHTRTFCRTSSSLKISAMESSSEQVSNVDNNPLPHCH